MVRNKRRKSPTGASGTTEKTSPANNKKKSPPIVGKKAGTALRSVEQFRNIRVFISRLHPEETEDGVKTFVSGVIPDECTVQKMVTKFSTYSSFVVTCDVKYKEKVLSPEEWANGVIIRKFYGSLSVISSENKTTVSNISTENNDGSN